MKSKTTNPILRVLLLFALLAPGACTQHDSTEFSVEDYMRSVLAGNDYKEVVLAAHEIVLSTENHYWALAEAARTDANHLISAWEPERAFTEADFTLMKNTLGLEGEAFRQLVKKIEMLTNRILAEIPEKEKHHTVAVMEELGKHIFKDVEVMRVAMRGAECCPQSPNCAEQFSCMSGVCSEYNRCKSGASSGGYSLFSGSILTGSSLGTIIAPGPGTSFGTALGFSIGVVAGTVYWGYSSSECRRLRDTNCNFCKTFNPC